MGSTDEDKTKIEKQPDNQSGDDEEIRQIAYQLWLDEGCPEGRHHDHWLKAEEILHARQVTRGKTTTGTGSRAKAATQPRAINPATKTKPGGGSRSLTEQVKKGPKESRSY